MIGVLAFHGGFAEHISTLRKAGIECCEVRTLEDLERVDGLIIPGGESTVIAKFLISTGMGEAISARAADANFQIYGTCAGMILLAKKVDNLKFEPLGLLDISVERNAYGRQVASFISYLEIGGRYLPVGHFIRAPKITRVGEGVEVLSSHGGAPVFVRQGNIWASSFHPELSGETAIHEMIFNSLL